MLTDLDIIKLADDASLLHLAKTPIYDKDKQLLKLHSQLYALGFNVGGRPDGLWLSYGNKWLAKTQELDNVAFPLCCYIYRVGINEEKILKIRNDDEFLAFDGEFSSYWINMDYFTLDFTDYMTEKQHRKEKKYQLDLSRLRRQPREPMRSVLLKNKIIFDNVDTARAECSYYQTTDIPLERFKYKDWNEVGAKYQGIVFENWEKCPRAMSYLWYQSLDISSGCIWDTTCINNLELKYSKVGENQWVVS
jgi:hypothetical protein